MTENRLGQIFLYESGSVQGGMNAVSPNRTRLSTERPAVIYVAHIISRAPPQQLAVQG